jgi:DNA (cytosine-5)-methyltransferase 1
MVLRHVDLCSGIGGFALGFEWAGLSKPVLFCDIEPWSRKILAKHWSDVPIEEDVKVLANEPERIPELGRDSILTAGYPCQPFSQAGKRRGAEDDRHIWPYIRQIVAHKRPTWCVFENVYGHVSMGLDQVLSDLEADGYATRPFIVPACGVDAAHRRDRIWIVGYSQHNGSSAGRNIRQLQREPDGKAQEIEQPKRTDSRSEDVGNAESIRWHGRTETTGRAGQTHQQDEPQLEVWGEFGGSGEDVSNTDSQQNNDQWGTDEQRWQPLGWDKQTSQQEDRKASADSFDRCNKNVSNTDSISPQGVGSKPNDARQAGLRCREARGEKGFWAAEPSVGRVAHGIPRRVDRIKGLGNAIVPQIAMQIGLTIKNCHEAMGG